MSDLINRLRERADDMEFATSLETEAADQLEAQQAEIAWLSSVIDALHTAKKEVGQDFAAVVAEAVVHKKYRVAEIERLREALFAIESKCRDCETINLIGNTREAKIAGTLRSAITIARKAREQKP